MEPPAAVGTPRAQSTGKKRARTRNRKEGVSTSLITNPQNETTEETDPSKSAIVALSTLEDSVSNSEALSLVNTLIQQQQQQPPPHSHATTTTTATPDEYAAHYIPPLPEPREYLSWKFRDMNLLVGSDALVYRATTTNNTTTSSSSTNNSTTALTVRVEDARQMRALWRRHDATVAAGAFVPDHRHAPLQQRGKASYADAAKSQLLVEESKSEDDKPKNSKKGQSKSSSSFAAPNLDQVQLQTCIVPYANEPSSLGSSLLSSARHASVVAPRDEAANLSTDSQAPMVASPVSTVLDAYLDNIMANVPQLALCLQEKGFIQSVKLLRTEAIPSHFMQRETFDTSKPLEFMDFNAQSNRHNPTTTSGGSAASPAKEDIFSPQVMELNASALLRFLKTNCSRDNATYLLRREPHAHNIQLFDISSISTERQQKWIWWLAMISYRFAHRLRHLSQSHNTATTKAYGGENHVPDDPALRRSFRVRQRSLLQNTIDLLETLADMNGNAHESLTAAVREHLADTFLVGGGSSSSTATDDPLNDPTISATQTGHGAVPPSGLQTTPAATPALVPPPQAVSSHQPYAHTSADALGKAQDHLLQGIKILNRVLDQHLQQQQTAAGPESKRRWGQYQRERERAPGCIGRNVRFGQQRQ